MARLTPLATGDSLVEQYAALAAAVDALPGEAYERPTRLGWTVGGLVAHVAATAELVPALLAQPAPPAPTVELLDYFAATAGYATDVDRRTRDEAAGATPVELAGRLRAAVDVLRDALAGAPLDRLVAARPGALPLGDLLATRCVEGTVHALDLAAATGGPPVLTRGATRTAVRLTTAMLAARFPGRSVEVRVPPYAAVQCIAGPRHTRGTPPNVVETDPATWLELAAGRLAWADGVDRIRASGQRADLTALLPLLG